MRKLSRLQETTLLLIAERARRSDGYAVWAPARAHNCRIPLGMVPFSRSDSAVMSRCLARLEARGLVERASNVPEIAETNSGRRTTMVRLTEVGRAEVDRLTK